MIDPITKDHVLDQTLHYLEKIDQANDVLILRNIELLFLEPLHFLLLGFRLLP